MLPEEEEKNLIGVTKVIGCLDWFLEGPYELYSATNCKYAYIKPDRLYRRGVFDNNHFLGCFMDTTGHMQFTRGFAGICNHCVAYAAGVHGFFFRPVFEDFL